LSSLNAAATPVWQVQALGAWKSGWGRWKSLEDVGEDREHPWKTWGYNIKHKGNIMKKSLEKLGKSGEDLARIRMLSVCWIALL